MEKESKIAVYQKLKAPTWEQLEQRKAHKKAIDNAKLNQKIKRYI